MTLPRGRSMIRPTRRQVLRGRLTGAGACLAFVLEAGRGSQQAARVEQAAAVLVGRWEGVGGVGGDGVVRGGSLGAHRG